MHLSGRLAVAFRLVAFLALLTPLASHAADTTLDPFIFGGFVRTATFSVAAQLGFFTDQGLNVTFSTVCYSVTFTRRTVPHFL